MKLFRKLAALSLTAALSAGMVLPASAASAPSVQVDGGTVDTSAYITHHGPCHHRRGAGPRLHS